MIYERLLETLEAYFVTILYGSWIESIFPFTHSPIHLRCLTSKLLQDYLKFNSLFRANEMLMDFIEECYSNVT